MKIVICPGIHHPDLTTQLLQSLLQEMPQLPLQDVIIYPAHEYPAFSGGHILRFLHHQGAIGSPQPSAALLFLSFSAGVVGAIHAATTWQQQGGNVRALIAVDGWGVPLAGNFAIHRVSHDYFTHWSSALLGSPGESFYADPPVAHRDLWSLPHTAVGRWICPPFQPGAIKDTASTLHLNRGHPATAAQFLAMLLQRYLSITTSQQSL